jgi:hypothetical protein
MYSSALIRKKAILSKCGKCFKQMHGKIMGCSVDDCDGGEEDFICLVCDRHAQLCSLDGGARGKAYLEIVKIDDHFDTLGSIAGGSAVSAPVASLPHAHLLSAAPVLSANTPPAASVVPVTPVTEDAPGKNVTGDVGEVLADSKGVSSKGVTGKPDDAGGVSADKTGAPLTEDAPGKGVTGDVGEVSADSKGVSSKGVTGKTDDAGGVSAETDSLKALTLLSQTGGVGDYDQGRLREMSFKRCMITWRRTWTDSVVTGARSS